MDGESPFEHESSASGIVDATAPPATLSDRNGSGNRHPDDEPTASYLSELSFAIRNAVTTPVQQMFVSADSGVAEPVPPDQTTGLVRPSRLTPRTHRTLASALPSSRPSTTRQLVQPMEEDVRNRRNQLPIRNNGAIRQVRNNLSPPHVPRRLEEFDDVDSDQDEQDPHGHPWDEEQAEDGDGEADRNQQDYQDEIFNLTQAVAESTLEAWSTAALPQLIRSEYVLGQLGQMIDDRIAEVAGPNGPNRRMTSQETQALRANVVQDLRRPI